jgi:hypothetical protein
MCVIARCLTSKSDTRLCGATTVASSSTPLNITRLTLSPTRLCEPSSQRVNRELLRTGLEVARVDVQHRGRDGDVLAGAVDFDNHL